MDPRFVLGLCEQPALFKRGKLNRSDGRVPKQEPLLAKNNASPKRPSTQHKASRTPSRLSPMSRTPSMDRPTTSPVHNMSPLDFVGKATGLTPVARYGFAESPSPPRKAASPGPPKAEVPNPAEDRFKTATLQVCELLIAPTETTSIKVVLQLAQTLCDAESAVLYLVKHDDNGNQCGLVNAVIPDKPLSIAGLAGAAVSSMKTVLIQHTAYEDPRYSRHVDQDHFGLTDSLCYAPILNARGQLMAVLGVWNKVRSVDNPHGCFTSHDARLVTFLGPHCYKVATAERKIVAEEKQEQEERLPLFSPPPVQEEAVEEEEEEEVLPRTALLPYAPLELMLDEMNIENGTDTAVLTGALKHAMEAVHAEAAAIYLESPGKKPSENIIRCLRVESVGGVVSVQEVSELHGSMAHKAFSASAPCHTATPLTDATFCPRYDRLVKNELKNVFAVPIVPSIVKSTTAVRALGVLVINNATSKTAVDVNDAAVVEAHKAQLCFCAVAIGLGLYASRQRHSEAVKLKQCEKQASAIASLTSCEELHPFAAVLARQVADAFDATHAVVHLCVEGRELHPLATEKGVLNPDEVLGIILAVDDYNDMNKPELGANRLGLAGNCAKGTEGKAIRLESSFEDMRFGEAADVHIGNRPQSSISAPIVDSNMQVLGVVQVERKCPFTSGDEEVLCNLLASSSQPLIIRTRHKQLVESRASATWLITEAQRQLLHAALHESPGVTTFDWASDVIEIICTRLSVQTFQIFLRDQASGKLLRHMSSASQLSMPHRNDLDSELQQLTQLNEAEIEALQTGLAFKCFTESSTVLSDHPHDQSEFNVNVDLATCGTEQLLTIHIPDGSRNAPARGCLQLMSKGFTSQQVSIAEEAAALIGQAMIIRECVSATTDQSNRRRAALSISSATLTDLPTIQHALAVAMSMMCAFTNTDKACLVLCEDGWWAAGAALRVVGLSWTDGQPPALVGNGVLVEEGDDTDPVSSEAAEFAGSVLELGQHSTEGSGLVQRDGKFGIPLRTAEGQSFGCVVLHGVGTLAAEEDVQCILAAMKAKVTNSDLASLVVGIRDAQIAEAVVGEDKPTIEDAK